jgi:hypothetical protein
VVPGVAEFVGQHRVGLVLGQAVQQVVGDHHVAQPGQPAEVYRVGDLARPGAHHPAVHRHASPGRQPVQPGLAWLIQPVRGDQPGDDGAQRAGQQRAAGQVPGDDHHGADPEGAGDGQRGQHRPEQQSQPDGEHGPVAVGPERAGRDAAHPGIGRDDRPPCRQHRERGAARGDRAGQEAVRHAAGRLLDGPHDGQPSRAGAAPGADRGQPLEQHPQPVRPLLIRPGFDGSGPPGRDGVQHRPGHDSQACGHGQHG